MFTRFMSRRARRCSQQSELMFNVSCAVHGMIYKGYWKRNTWSYVRILLKQYGCTLYDKAHTGVWIAHFARKCTELDHVTIVHGPKGPLYRIRTWMNLRTTRNNQKHQRMDECRQDHMNNVRILCVARVCVNDFLADQCGLGERRHTVGSV